MGCAETRSPRTQISEHPRGAGPRRVTTVTCRDDPDFSAGIDRGGTRRARRSRRLHPRLPSRRTRPAATRSPITSVRACSSKGTASSSPSRSSTASSIRARATRPSISSTSRSRPRSGSTARCHTCSGRAWSVSGPSCSSGSPAERLPVPVPGSSPPVSQPSTPTSGSSTGSSSRRPWRCSRPSSPCFSRTAICERQHHGVLRRSGWRAALLLWRARGARLAAPAARPPVRPDHARDRSAQEAPMAAGGRARSADPHRPLGDVQHDPLRSARLPFDRPRADTGRRQLRPDLLHRPHRVLLARLHGVGLRDAEERRPRPVRCETSGWVESRASTSGTTRHGFLSSCSPGGVASPACTDPISSSSSTSTSKGANAGRRSRRS